MNADKFWNSLKKSDDTNGCWEWQGANAGKHSYGHLRFGGRRWKAHRLAWTLINGEIPTGINVCHNCDNPACCRPNHLFLGTQQDNMQNAAAKGRVGIQQHPERYQRGDAHYWRRHPEAILRGDQHPARKHPECLARGEHTGAAKLTDAQVIEIRQLAAEGVSHKALSEQFGTIAHNIGKIVRRETWKHL